MLGLRSVIYGTHDLEAAKKWYMQVTGKQPYFDEPFYVGFNVGGFELGLNPNAEPATAGVTTYWGVNDIQTEYRRLLELGAIPHAEITNVGDKIEVASLLDPFGNILGIIYNPEFKIE